MPAETCTADALRGSHTLEHNFQVFFTEARTLSKIPYVTRISWQAFSPRCSNTSKSLIGDEYTTVFKCLYSQKSRGFEFRGSCTPVDWASASYPFLTESLVHAQSMSDPSRMNDVLSLKKRHVFQEFCYIIQQTQRYTTPVILLGKKTGPKLFT
jgi:hypothetical protein